MKYVRLQVSEVFSLSKLFLFSLSKLFLLTLGKRTHFQFSFADLVRYVVQDNKKIPLLLKDLFNSIFTEKKILQAHILCHCPTVKAPFPPLWIVRLISFLLPCKSKKLNDLLEVIMVRNDTILQHFPKSSLELHKRIW